MSICSPALQVFPIRFQYPPGDVAQWLEHLLCTQGVVGSSPIVSTKCHYAKPTSGGLVRLDVSADELSVA